MRPSECVSACLFSQHLSRLRLLLASPGGSGGEALEVRLQAVQSPVAEERSHLIPCSAGRPVGRRSTGRSLPGSSGREGSGGCCFNCCLQFVGKTFNVHGYLVTVLAERNLGLTWGDRGSSRALGDGSSWCDPSSGTPASSGHCGFLARTPAASHLR